jgi:hypothetical protein
MPAPYAVPLNLSSVRGISKSPDPGSAWQLVNGPVVGQSPGWPFERDWVAWTTHGVVLLEEVYLIDCTPASMRLFDATSPYPVIEYTIPGIGVNGAEPVERSPGIFYPAPGVYPAGTTFDLWFYLPTWVGSPAAVTLGASCTFHISDTYVPTPTGGIWVGSIVLATPTCA